MGTIAIYCQQDDLVEATEQFAAFEDLDVQVQRIVILEQLSEVAALEGLIMEGSGDALALIQTARALREGSKNAFLPLILLLPELNSYHRALCFDLDYALPCSAPLQSADFVPSLKKLVLFSRKKRPLIDLRERISTNLLQKQFDKAQSLIETYAQQEADAFRIQLLKAKLATEMRDLHAALAASLSAVKENNRSLEARFLLANSYLEMGEFEKASEVTEKSLKLGPEHPPFITLRARLHLHAGQWDVAKGVLQESLKRDPQQLQALAGLMVAEAVLGNQDSVRPHVKGAALTVIRLVQVYALELARLGKVADAEKVLERAQQVLGQHPDSYKVWMNMGLHARRLQNWKKALSFFKACAATAPKDYDKVQAYLAEAEKMQRKAS